MIFSFRTLNINLDDIPRQLVLETFMNNSTAVKIISQNVEECILSLWLTRKK